MGLAKVYAYTEFEVSSFTRSKDTAKWLGARGVVLKLARESPSFFYRTLSNLASV